MGGRLQCELHFSLWVSVKDAWEVLKTKVARMEIKMIHSLSAVDTVNNEQYFLIFNHNTSNWHDCPKYSTLINSFISVGQIPSQPSFYKWGTQALRGWRLGQGREQRAGLWTQAAWALDHYASPDSILGSSFRLPPSLVLDYSPNAISDTSDRKSTSGTDPQAKDVKRKYLQPPVISYFSFDSV